MDKFTEVQEKALRQAKDGPLVTAVPDRTETDSFGEKTPGTAVFRTLIKAGLVFETEEDPITLDDGTLFHYTPSYYLTEAGGAALAALDDTPSFSF